MSSHLFCHHSHLFTPQPTFPHLQAKVDAAKVSADWLERLSEMTKTPTSQLRFIMDAWSQVRHFDDSLCMLECNYVIMFVGVGEMKKTPTSQLRFIMDAWSQVGEVIR